jgi:deoxyribodipyrimidine photo-lyase
MSKKVNIIWFRRDLRLHDNAALYHALKDNSPVVPVFIFDRIILDELEDEYDRRVEFIYNALLEMQSALVSMGSTLHVYYDTPANAWQHIVNEYPVGKVFTNHDYEPYAGERDNKIATFLKKQGIEFNTFKDQVILEKDEVIKDDGTPYTVFTPYSKRWKATLTDFHLKAYPTEKYFANFFKQRPVAFPELTAMGFKPSGVSFPSKELNEEIVKKYSKQRDFPGIEGTSRMGVHLRFGTVSIRDLARRAQALNETYLNELIWRDFYHMILWHFPHVGKGKAFKPAYDFIEWRNNEEEFERWCTGQTGYPIVDAGMRQLNETGFLHNRVRMVVASFLSKHLLIDWRWGEAYFARKLLDFDLAANNGGWQWAAGSGCDAAPYFRVFNPYLQTKKFDPDLKYIRQWVPEFEEFSYPKPIVEHEFARKRCLETYGRALKQELI